MTYQRPQITDLGNVRELTAGSAFQNVTPANNKGHGNPWKPGGGGGGGGSNGSHGSVSGVSGPIGHSHT